jgi:hypothetical protein
VQGDEGDLGVVESLLLLLFFLPFTWGRHRCARATTALPRATSLELLILFDSTQH